MILTRLQLYLAAGVAVVLAGLLLWQWGTAVSLRGKLADERRERAEERVAAVDAAASAIDQVRSEERRIGNTIGEALRDERNKSDRLALDLAAAAGTADRLRNYAAALAAASRCDRPADPSAGSASAPTQAPGDVLALMLGRMDASGRELAAYADRARLAGELCQISADAVTTLE